MSHDLDPRFAIALGIAKNATTEAGRRDARQLAANVASEAGLSLDAAIAMLDEEDRKLASAPARAASNAADDDDDEPRPTLDGDDEDVGPEGTVDDGETEDDDDQFEESAAAPSSPAEEEPADAWQAPIASFVATRERVTVGEIAAAALDGGPGRPATSDSRRIAACLERLGWHREKKNWRGQIEWRRSVETTDHLVEA